MALLLCPILLPPSVAFLFGKKSDGLRRWNIWELSRILRCSSAYSTLHGSRGAEVDIGGRSPLVNCLGEVVWTVKVRQPRSSAAPKAPVPSPRHSGI